VQSIQRTGQRANRSAKQSIALDAEPRISAAAVNYRLRELGMISDGKATSNYVEMSRRGWLKAEPNGIAPEQSSVLRDIINDLISQGITKTKVSAELMVSPSEVEGLLFGLANITTIDGAGNPTPKRDVRLTLVK
jgi:Zn-dependent peptidase ImmA (M78 family)